MNLFNIKKDFSVVVAAVTLFAGSQLLISCAMTNGDSPAENTASDAQSADTASADSSGAVEMLPTTGDPQTPVTTADPAPPVEALPVTTPEPVAQAKAPAPMPEAKPVTASGELADYQIKKGDTLMSIAFDVYGDVMMWKSLYETNRATIKNANALNPGTSIKYQRPASDPVIDRAGDQYKIKKGDTLGTIAYDIYGKTQKWKKLWENNKTLIKDPNRIYAGFYLYYQISEAEKAEAESLKANGAPPQLGKVEKVKPVTTKDQQTSNTVVAPAQQGLSGLQNLMQRAPASVPSK